MALHALDQLRQRFGIAHTTSNKGIRVDQKFQHRVEGGKIGVRGILGTQRGDSGSCPRNIPAAQGKDDIVGQQGRAIIEEYVELLHTER